MAEVVKKDFGSIEGRKVELFTLTNDIGITARITNYGATLVGLEVPDRDGKLEDIVLGFDSLEGYLGKNPYFGATIGRFANRIKDGIFELNGVEYQLAKNEKGINHLHGGVKGFDKVIWSAGSYIEADAAVLKLSYTSPDGEENYPGKLDVDVVYKLTNDNELQILFHAATDKDTPVNLTHHSYFNLNGQGNGDIYDHQMYINAEHYTPVDDNLIPTGAIKLVKNTPMDFTTPHLIGERAADVEGGGYDHNFVIDKPEGKYTLAARTIGTKTGRVMETYTTDPGIQFYAGNFLDGINGKNGKVYNKNFGFCLEPQNFPDAVNKPQFPMAIVKAGSTYIHNMAYKFKIAD
jgi:aldose 1-epimerase